MQFNYGVLLGALMPWMVWAQPNAWINEFHYDNVGADADEFIEVVLENAAAYALSDFAVVLYNGSGGTSYGTHRLDTFTEGATEGAYTVYFKYIPGLQNGAPDGLALCYQGHLLQFLSYEGTLTAVGGCADGILSTDIGVAEDGTTPAGYSLQLTGLGARYADFSWASPQPASPGAINTTQRLIGQVTCRLALLGTLEVLSAAQGRAQILGTDGIQRVQNSPVQPNVNLQLISVTGPGGGAVFSETAPGVWEFTGSGSPPTEAYAVYQRLDLQNPHNQFFLQVSTLCPSEPDGTLEAHLDPFFAFELLPQPALQVTPNPFRTQTVLTLSLPEAALVTVAIYDLLGRHVATLAHESLAAGRHQLVWNGTSMGHVLPAGLYLVRTEVQPPGRAPQVHTHRLYRLP